MFEYVLLSAKHIYFVDACVDNGLVQDVVSYLCNRKQFANGDFHAIWNQHVRATNRRCHMMVNKQSNRQVHVSMQQHVCERVREAIVRGDKAVVASTTKSFTNMLVDCLKDTLIERGIKWIVHNGDQERKSDPTNSWGGVDLLVYSPSIGAGVSFNEPHFDVLFAYIENSFYTPTVDFVLQQLFRVRQLKRGDMFLYLNDGFLSDEVKCRFPSCPRNIEDWMDANIMTLPDQYCKGLSYESEHAVNVVQKSIVYDKSKMSYKILQGIVAIKNMSLQSFHEILINTLRDDYHVNCTTEEYNCAKTSTKDRVPNDNPATHLDLDQINEDIVLKKTDYHALCRVPPEKKTELEKHMMWIYEATVCMWRTPPSNIDAWFYQHCIGWNMNTIKRAKEMFSKALRWHIASTAADMSGIMQMLEVELRCMQGDLNMIIFNKSPLAFYQMIMEGRYILDNVLGNEMRNLLIQNGIVKIELGAIANRIRDYASVLTHTRFAQLRSLMAMDKRAYPSLEKLRETKINQHAFIAKVLDTAFGVKFRLAKRTAGRQVWHMENHWYRDILEKYRPATFIASI
jgi:hypothetical protein